MESEKKFNSILAISGLYSLIDCNYENENIIFKYLENADLFIDKKTQISKKFNYEINSEEYNKSKTIKYIYSNQNKLDILKKNYYDSNEYRKIRFSRKSIDLSLKYYFYICSQFSKNTDCLDLDILFYKSKLNTKKELLLYIIKYLNNLILKNNYELILYSLDSFKRYHSDRQNYISFQLNFPILKMLLRNKIKIITGGRLICNSKVYNILKKNNLSPKKNENLLDVLMDANL